MLKEEDFLNYLRAQFPGTIFSKGYSLSSINIVKTVAIMSCLYLGEDELFAAKYNRNMGFFSDAMQIKKNDIKKIYFIKKFLGDTLVVETTQKMPDGKNLMLKMSMPKFSASKWHQTNLEALKNSIPCEK